MNIKHSLLSLFKQVEAILTPVTLQQKAQNELRHELSVVAECERQIAFHTLEQELAEAKITVLQAHLHKKDTFNAIQRNRS